VGTGAARTGRSRPEAEYCKIGRYPVISKLTADEIIACKDLDQLVELLRGEKDEIPGSSNRDTGVKVARRIEQVRHGHRDLRYVTGALEIRTLVEMMLPQDKTYKKYVQSKGKELI